MKKFVFALIFLLECFNYAYSQTIQSVISKPSASHPTFSSSANAGDAVEIIMHYLNTYASVKCSNTLGDSLKPKIDALKTKYIGIIPKGKTADFLVLTNKFACTAIAIIQKTQEIHVVNNACSINDIKLVQPDLIYNPNTTGFFTISVKF